MSQSSPANPDSKIDFVIITALPEELKAVLTQLPPCKQVKGPGDIRIYEQCDLPIESPDHTQYSYRLIVTGMLGMGQTQAATAAADAIRCWHPRYVLLVGIAGGNAFREAQLGDILVADQIVDYESQKLTAQKREFRWKGHQVDPVLLNASKYFLDEDWHKAIKIKPPKEGVPKRIFGPIASGDKVIANSQALKTIFKDWPELIGVEMEAAGVATAASQSPDRPGFFMVRGVSDLADAQKDSSEVNAWRAYACKAAAAFALALLKSGPVPLMDEAVSQTENTEEKFLGFQDRYLSWVANYYNQANLFGMERLKANNSLPNCSLVDVFLPMTLSRNMGENESRQDNILPFKDLLMVNSRMVIVGGQGSGKGTLLKYLAVRLAQHIQGQSELDFKLPRGQTRLIPLLIPLRGYSAYRQNPGRQENVYPGNLIGYIRYSINQSPGFVGINSFTIKVFEELLLRKQCLLMFDGLDEVIDMDERAQVRAQIEALASGYSGNYFIVTARVTGYREKAIFNSKFTRLNVLPLESDQTRRLVEKWCHVLYPKDEESHADDINLAIRDINLQHASSDLALVTTPLMTVMVVGVKWSKVKLPRERARLYDAAIEVMLRLLYDEENEFVGGLAKAGGKVKKQRQWLEMLAYGMNCGGQNAVIISQERLRAILGDQIGGAELRRFLGAIHNRGGIFEETTGGYQFAHLSFQDFLSACYIVRYHLGDALAGYVTDPWWRETLLLVYGCAVLLPLPEGSQPFDAQGYLALLAKQPADARLAGVELAAAALLEVEQRDLALQRRLIAELQETLTAPTLHALGRVRGLTGRTLASLGDPRPVLDIETMEFCLVSHSPDDAQDLPDFWMGRYPVTQAQFHQFVQDYGYTRPEYWEEAQQHGYWAAKGFAVRRQDEQRTRPCAFGEVFSLPSYPVVGICWYEALSFTRWLQEKAQAGGWLPAGWQVRLPSEEEWQKSAQGGANIPNQPVICSLSRLPEPPALSLVANPLPGRTFPWGNGFSSEHANIDLTGIGATSAVGSFPNGASCYGCLDLAGNVWEWTRTLFPTAGDVQFTILRGGSWLNNEHTAHCDYSYKNAAHIYNNNFGFRLVIRPGEQE